MAATNLNKDTIKKCATEESFTHIPTRIYNLYSLWIAQLSWRGDRNYSYFLFWTTNIFSFLGVSNAICNEFELYLSSLFRHPGLKPCNLVLKVLWWVHTTSHFYCVHMLMRTVSKPRNIWSYLCYSEVKTKKIYIIYASLLNEEASNRLAPLTSI